jgi:hypothetical protein
MVNKKIVLFSIFSLMLFSLLLTGCTSCNKPYIKVGNSCCLDNNDNNICDKDENIAKEKPQETQLASDEYQFKINEIKTLNQWDKEVTLVSMDNEGKIVVKVNGVEREIKETNYMEIIDGLEITSKRINYDYVDPNKNYVILKINKYTEKPDEYLVNIDKPIKVKGELLTITLKDIDYEDHSIKINVNNENLIRIREGYTENIYIIPGLEITNVKAFPRDIRYENYAIIKVIVPQL